jgi:glycerol-3-phosphate dehydrogenase
MLTRRTRISIEYPHRGTDCAQQVAELMGGVLGWAKTTVTREVETYLARVAAERESQTQTDDQSADALRHAAPEARQQLVPEQIIAE